MLHQILRIYEGALPDDVKVIFANTGKEREETLRFVHECGSRWGVHIHWVEWRDAKPCFEETGYNSASRMGEPFDAIVHHSILQTCGRSINTSFTVVLTLCALLLFAGASVHYFVLALLIGIISGTYSSIFNASPLLVVWQLWDDRRRAEQIALARGSRRTNG